MSICDLGCPKNLKHFKCWHDATSKKWQVWPYVMGQSQNTGQQFIPQQSSGTKLPLQPAIYLYHTWQGSQASTPTKVGGYQKPVVVCCCCLTADTGILMVLLCCIVIWNALFFFNCINGMSYFLMLSSYVRINVGKWVLIGSIYKFRVRNDGGAKQPQCVHMVA